MDEILKEQGLQKSGCVTSECLVEVGRLIGANQIIGGSISKVGNTFSVSARIINVETGKIEKVTDYDYKQPPVGIFSSQKSGNEKSVEHFKKSGMKFVAKQLIGKEPDYKMQYSPGTVIIRDVKKND